VDRARLIALTKQYVWQPYTPMDAYLASTNPIVAVRAEGARFWDADGRSFIDGNASWWTSLLGHSHPRLVAVIQEQAAVLGHVAMAGITHAPAAELAQALIQVAPPGLERVFYSDDGSTAVEVALKLALQFWYQNGRPQRKRFVALSGAFHGDTLGVTSIGGVDVFKRPFAGLLLDCVHVPVAEEQGYDRAFAAVAELLRAHADEVAAVIVEPVVQGAIGMRIYDPSYLKALRALTSELDILLVLDEVFTGYGRTGPMWASEHAGISPDLMCVGKGYSGGLLPMAATLATRRIFEGFLGEPERAFYYGHTFCGNPLGAAVAREVLKVYREERVLEGIPVRAERIRRAFARLGELSGVARTRALGMVGALDLAGKEGYLAASGHRVCEAAEARGLYLRPLGNTVYITPAVNIDLATLDELLGILEESVRVALG
jgi:adenosylmethionine-8-amino-7-oxononanoate aminotransferase